MFQTRSELLYEYLFSIPCRLFNNPLHRPSNLCSGFLNSRQGYVWAKQVLISKFSMSWFEKSYCTGCTIFLTDFESGRIVSCKNHPTTETGNCLCRQSKILEWPNLIIILVFSNLLPQAVETIILCSQKGLLRCLCFFHSQNSAFFNPLVFI